jgi:hypothetical protein
LQCGFSYTAWIAVRKDDRRSVVPQCHLDDFPRMDADMCQGGPEGILSCKHSVLRIQQYDGNHLVLTVMQEQQQVIAYGSG